MRTKKVLYVSTSESSRESRRLSRQQPLGEMDLSHSRSICSHIGAILVGFLLQILADSFS